MLKSAKTRVAAGIGALALAAPVALAACHTNDPLTLCREYVDSLNAFSYRYSLVSATVEGGDARCLIRRNADFTTFVRCIDGTTHDAYAC